MNTTERIDYMICDRIETMITQAKIMEQLDPELADYILIEALEFARTIDEMDDNDGIFWCKSLKNQL